MIKYLKYLPVCVCAAGMFYTGFFQDAAATPFLIWSLLTVLAWVPLNFPKREYIKACKSHFEVMRGKTVLQKIHYSDVGMIVLTLQSQNIRSPKLDSKGRDAALISLHSPESNYLRNMVWWSTMKSKYGVDDDVYISIPFVPSELHYLMEKTLCNLYITEQMYKLYEHDLFSVIQSFKKRIYICFKQGQNSAFTSLDNYQKHIQK